MCDMDITEYMQDGSQYEKPHVLLKAASLSSDQEPEEAILTEAILEDAGIGKSIEIYVVKSQDEYRHLESAPDLDSALVFINRDSRLSDLPIYCQDSDHSDPVPYDESEMAAQKQVSDTLEELGDDPTYHSDVDPFNESRGDDDGDD